MQQDVTWRGMGPPPFGRGRLGLNLGCAQYPSGLDTVIINASVLRAASYQKLIELVCRVKPALLQAYLPSRS